MRSKGLGNAAMVVIAIAVLGVVAIGASQFQTQQASTVEPTDYDGGFDTYQAVQELTGYNDLSVTAESLNESNTVVDDANAVTKYNVNESNGDTLRYAFGIEVSGPMESVDVEIVPQATTADQFDVVNAKLVQDESDDNSFDSAPVAAQFSADADDEVDATVNGLEGGEYALVLETRGTSTNSVSLDQDLYSITMDADTDADSDEAEELSVTIDNVASE